MILTRQKIKHTTLSCYLNIDTMNRFPINIVSLIYWRSFNRNVFAINAPNYIWKPWNKKSYMEGLSVCVCVQDEYMYTVDINSMTTY